MALPIDDNEILRAAAVPARVDCLQEAIRLTTGDRRADYGEPVANHARIAGLTALLTGLPTTARQAALAHVATKLARLSHAPLHRDSYVDAMAYLGIAYECALAEAGPQGDWRGDVAGAEPLP